MDSVYFVFNFTNAMNTVLVRNFSFLFCYAKDNNSGNASKDKIQSEFRNRLRINFVLVIQNRLPNECRYFITYAFVRVYYLFVYVFVVCHSWMWRTNCLNSTIPMVWRNVLSTTPCGGIYNMRRVTCAVHIRGMQFRRAFKLATWIVNRQTNYLRHGVQWCLMQCREWS